MKTKHAAVDLTDLAIGLLILGITVAIGARVLTLYRDSRLTDLATNQVANESTVEVVNFTGTILDEAWVLSVDACYNNSGHKTASLPIGTANYSTSVDPSNGYVTITGTPGAIGGDHNNTVWNCSYTIYNTSEAQFYLPDAAATGLAEYGNWFDIIVIVGIAGLILSLIFLAFGRRGGEGEQVY